MVSCRYVHNDRLLDALTRQAFTAIRVSPGTRARYDRQRSRGVEHHAALRHVANRFVGILHGCLKSGSLYDKNLAWATAAASGAMAERCYAARLLNKMRCLSGAQVTSCYPKLSVDPTGNALVSKSGAIILIRAAEKTGLTTTLSESLSPWRKPTAQHDPEKILLDLALSLAVGGDCLADIATLREQPALFWPVESDAPVSRLISTLAANALAALSAINSARAAARKITWSHAGEHAPNHDIDPQHPLIVDLDATLVTCHSEKEKTAPNFKRGCGFHPLLAFVDHGVHGTVEPSSFLLRPENAGSNTAADHIHVTRQALAQLPFQTSGAVGKKVLIRTDGAGGTHAFLEYLTARRLPYSVGFTLTDMMAQIINDIPEDLWIPALDRSGGILVSRA